MVSSDPSTELAAMELFEKAMECPAAERERNISSQGDIADDVKRRALELLAANVGALAALKTGGAANIDDDEETHPEQIGAYRILRLLGRGGMGAVYMGERDSDDFDHVVAIKLIKSGLLSESLIERFRRERQILAQLNHQHIAHLHDGGETDDGAPYMVMEYVDGIPLTGWIEREKPDLEKRLELFMQICSAVEFAHQNLIIHRDLTPSNVLIKTGDQAKLIDFGIARPHVEDDDGSAASTFSGLSLTPGFAAPERSRGAAANTLSDIYSLGQILRTLTQSYGKSEIDAVVEMATMEEPAARYATAHGLADDVNCYREGLPVRAYSNNKRYRFQKFVARQKLAVGSALLVLLLLIAGLGGTSWAYQQAEQARTEAEQRFGEVRELATFMLFDLYDELQPVPGNTKALTKIADKARTYLDALNRDGRADIMLQMEIAVGYKRLSDVMGNPEGSNLGRREEAGELLKQAVKQLEGLHRGNSQNIEITRSLAEATYALAIFSFIANDDNETATERATQSEQLYTSIVKNGRGNDEDRLNQMQSALQAAKPLVWIDRGAEGVAKLTALRAEIDEFVRMHPENYTAVLLKAATYSSLASTMSWHYDLESEDYRRSIPIVDEAIEIYLAQDKKFPDRTDARQALIAAYFVRALTHSDLENWQKTLNDLESGETIAKQFLSKDPDNSGMARRVQVLHSQMTTVLAELNRFEEATSLAQNLLDDRQKISQNEPDNHGYFRDQVTAKSALADVLKLAGKKDAACDAYRSVSADWKIIAERWTVSELIKKNDIQSINDNLAEC